MSLLVFLIGLLSILAAQAPGIDFGQILEWLLASYGPLILDAILTALFGAIVALSIKATAWLKVHLSDRQLRLLENIFDQAVLAAEQIARREDVQGFGEYKRNEARRFAQAELDRLKIPINVMQIDRLIEAAVLRNLWQLKPPPPPPEEIDHAATEAALAALPTVHNT